MFRSEAIFGAFAKHWLLGMGLAIIACVALLPRGLVGLPAWVARPPAGRQPRMASQPVAQEVGA